MYDEIIQAVIDMAVAASGAVVRRGSMPPLEGIGIDGASGSFPIFFDMGSNERLSLVVNGKSASAQTVIGWLDAIHQNLTRRKRFPQGDGWQIYAIETVASARLLGREENSQWLYGSSLVVKINVKGSC